jgi:beta-glucanase (GH16 family)
MTKFLRTLSLSILVLMISSFNVSKTVAQQDWRLFWSDEFNGEKGSSVDSKFWKYDLGGGGWGNNELEFYTNKTKNVYQDGTGFLVIKAIKETIKDGCWYGDCEYTSGRILTKGTLERQYGRIEARIRIPKGQGLWPAFWMLGSDIGSVNWPNCGEIDILENIGKEPKTVHGTIHGPGYSGANGIGLSYSSEQAFSDGFHLYAIEWEAEAIRWYVDGNLYQTRTPKDLPEGKKWVFDHKFFIILNLAVGGGWPGNPDAKTQFPQSMKVDYVRVYSR